MYRFMVFMMFFPIGVFLYQTRETVLSMTVRQNRTPFFISLDRFPIYHLNNMTGHLSSFPVANILGVTSLVFMLSPPCLVLVGPSAKVRNSFPSSRCKVKSFIWWCSCRPRRPKCWVSSHSVVLSRARGGLKLLPLLLSNFWIGLVAFLWPALAVSWPSLPGLFWS